jgi:hypothetical protein
MVNVDYELWSTDPHQEGTVSINARVRVHLHRDGSVGVELTDHNGLFLWKPEIRRIVVEAAELEEGT